MMAALELHAVARYSALRLIDSMVEGTVICAFAALLLRLRRQSAGLRFAIAFSALLAVALMPFAGGLWGDGGVSSATHPALMVPESWALYLFSGWAALASFYLLFVARALWHLHRLRKSCTPVDPSVLGLQWETQLQGSRRRVSLCTSEKVSVPTAIGLTKPAIVLPRWVLEELTPSELNQVVLHELAHLRRWDDWTNLAQRIVKALFFFHPAVWWIEKKLAFEREMACDDAVLAQTESPRAYAECLAHLAERSFLRRSIALSQAALGHVSQISQRVAQILDRGRQNGNSRSWKLAVTSVAGFAFVCAVGISKAPKLVAFEESVPTPVFTGDSSPLPMMGARATLASLTEQAVRQKPALAKFTPPTHELATRRRTSVQRTLTSRSGGGDGLIHLASAKTAPVTQTVFVFISTGEMRSPNEVYQVQVWRLTVLKSSVDPSRHSAPPKKT